MDITELKELLNELAVNDLADGTDIYDHPCSVAIRALDVYHDGLLSISKNTCCDRCQEAAMVAKNALGIKSE